MPAVKLSVKSGRTFLLFGLVLAVGLGGGYGLQRGGVAMGSPSDDPVRDDSTPEASLPVEVVNPRAGGLARNCLHPGTLEPIEAADPYPKVSGFLAEQSVDIG